MGDLFKKKKKRRNNPQVWGHLAPFLLLPKRAWSFPLAQGDGEERNFWGLGLPCRGQEGKMPHGPQTFLFSNGERLQPPIPPWGEKKVLQSSVCEAGWGISKRWRGEGRRQHPLSVPAVVPLWGGPAPPRQTCQHNWGCHDGCVRAGCAEQRESPAKPMPPPGHEASESWTEPTYQSGKVPSCTVWRGAGQPPRGFCSLEIGLSWGVWKESLHFSKCSRRGTGAGLWGWPGFMASDSPGELALSGTLAKRGNERGEGRESTTLQQNRAEIKASLRGCLDLLSQQIPAEKHRFLHFLLTRPGAELPHPRWKSHLGRGAGNIVQKKQPGKSVGRRGHGHCGKSWHGGKAKEMSGTAGKSDYWRPCSWFTCSSLPYTRNAADANEDHKLPKWAKFIIKWTARSYAMHSHGCAGKRCALLNGASMGASVRAGGRIPPAPEETHSIQHESTDLRGRSSWQLGLTAIINKTP